MRDKLFRRIFMNGKRFRQPHKCDFYKNDILSTVSKEIIQICPNYYEDLLRDIVTLLVKLSNKIDNCSDLRKNTFGRSYIYMTQTDFIKWLKCSLLSIPEFLNLNLSYNERSKGVSAQDKGRRTIVFTSIYDKTTEDSWKDDFIDLDAVLQNIECSLLNDYAEFTTCILCRHCSDGLQNSFTALECLTCQHNPRFTDNYTSRNKPFGNDFSHWCQSSCPNQRSICCWDCNKKDSCNDRCCGSYFTENKITCEGLVERE